MNITIRFGGRFFVIKEEYLKLLLESGFTKTQSKLYLTLVQMGATDVKALSKQTDVPRQEIYRALNQLQEGGYVERIISMPMKYKAISFRDLLSVVQNVKTNEYKKSLERTQFFLERIEENKQEQEKEQEYTIKIVEGKETIINKCRSAHANAQEGVCCCSIFQRWIQIGHEIHETIRKGVDRGVNYRMIIERPAGEINIPKEVLHLMEKDNFQVKIVSKQLKINAVIFDDKLTGFSLYPSKAVAETPMIWTNHPSILASFQEHFDRIWVENGTAIRRTVKP
jgi:sugar-specific transcriptional regulator TrmB